MVQALSGFRAGAGLIKATVLDSTYAVELFTRQSDMLPGRDWLRPDNTSDVINLSEETVETLSGKRFGYGKVTFTWRFRALTPKMTKYLLDTFFSSSGYYGVITVRTYNRASNEFEVYQCTARRKVWSDAAEPALGGYDNFEIEFVDGVRVTAELAFTGTGAATSNGVATLGRVSYSMGPMSGTATSGGVATLAINPSVIVVAGTATSAGTAILTIT